MSWKREDIVADVKRSNFDIDINLPYHELKNIYLIKRGTRSFAASGYNSKDLSPPTDKKENFCLYQEPDCPNCGADLNRNKEIEIYECDACGYKGMQYGFGSDSKRKWTFSFEDEKQIRHDYPDNGKFFIGTDDEAITEGKRLANEWEVKNNMWCLKIIRNSHGKITT